MRMLNIGMELPDGTEMHLPDVIRVAAKHLKVNRYAIVPKGKSEKTLIVVSENAAYESVYRLAEELDQDAIAMYDVNELHGEVIGPRDARWQPFNREYFQVY